MGSRGPKSTEEMMTRALADASTVHRLEPPLELWRDDEAEVWRRIVEALPADWFTAADAPLLVQYCRHIVQARLVAQLLRQQERGKSDLDLGVWTKLMRAQDAQTAAIARLATKMRLSQQATYGHRAAHTAKRNRRPRRPPWKWDDEEPDDGR
jgi:hypothetical protein